MSQFIGECQGRKKSSIKLVKQIPDTQSPLVTYTKYRIFNAQFKHNRLRPYKL